MRYVDILLLSRMLSWRMTSPPHQDFAGHRGLLQPGDLQWMVAGRGIVHAEMPIHTKGGKNPMGLQLWIDLPSEKKSVYRKEGSMSFSAEY